MIKKLAILNIFITGLMGSGCTTKPTAPPQEPEPFVPRVSNNPYYEPRWGNAMEVKQF